MHIIAGQNVMLEETKTLINNVKYIHCIDLTLKLPGEGKMVLPLNLNDKNIPNADFFLIFYIHTFFL